MVPSGVLCTFPTGYWNFPLYTPHCNPRLIKESIYIRVNNLTLNRNIGNSIYVIYWTGSFKHPGLKLNNNNNGQVQAHNNSPLQPVPQGQMQGQSENALSSEHELRGF